MLNLIKPLALNLYLIGWVLLLGVFIWRVKRHGMDRRFAIITLAVLWLVATALPGNLAMITLESNDFPDFDSLLTQGVNQVVVLTGGGGENLGDLATNAMRGGSYPRYLAGMEVAARLGPECKLVFTGGGEESPVAKFMYEHARRVQPERPMHYEIESSRTIHHPEGVRPFVDDRKPVVIVTSAFHMRRSLWIFRDAGYDPIPCPVNHRYTGRWQWHDVLPSLIHLRSLETAWNEYLKLFQYTFERQLHKN